MIIIGIDPHKASHTAVAIDEHETVLSEMTTRTCRTQTQRLRSWAEKFDERVWAVESANGLGYLLAQQLVAAGERVVDVPPALAARTRVLGSSRSQKNDPNDARSVAVTALRQPSLQTVHGDDHAKVMKLTAKRHRDLSRLRNQAACRVHALLLELHPGGLPGEYTVTRANTILDRIETTEHARALRVASARELIADITHYDAQLKAARKRIVEAVDASGSTLPSIRGCGPIVTAMIIGHTVDIARFASAAHFASYNATAPIEASSGERKRHRLNQRGNRQLNFAIHVIAVSQLRYPCPGRVYYDRKRAEGKNTKEAIRALKRQISDVVYRTMIADAKRVKVGPGGHPGTTTTPA
jgi:transposase